jgi:hypothetical protein
MTVESPLAEQQRAVVEFYIHSKWIKANLILEDENLFLEYANNKYDEQFNHISTIHETAEPITSQKRLINIVKPDNLGLGKISQRKFYYAQSIFLYRN